MNQRHRSNRNGLEVDADPDRYPERRCPCGMIFRVPVTSAQTLCGQCLVAKERKKRAKRKRLLRNQMAEAGAVLEAQRRADAQDDARRRNRKGGSVRDGARGSVRVVSGGLPTLGKRR